MTPDAQTGDHRADRAELRSVAPVQWSFLPELPNAATTLDSYRNEDGGWGEHRTQASRITNTCEALWCFGRLHIVPVDLQSSIRFLTGALNGTNPEPRQNCERVRDVCWVLLALNAISSLLNGQLSSKIDVLIDRASDALSEMTKTSRSLAIEPDSAEAKPATFILSLVALAWAATARYRRSRGADATVPMDRAQKTIATLLELRSSGKAWGDSAGSTPTAANTAYAFAAIAGFAELQSVSIYDHDLVAASRFLQASDLDVVSFERPACPAIRPYRHYTAAWAVLGYASAPQIDGSFGFQLVDRILSQYHNGGWSAFNLEGIDTPLTWTTALAAGSVASYASEVALSDLRSCFVPPKRRPLHQAARAVKLFRAEAPRRFLAILILVPTALVAVLTVLASRGADRPTFDIVAIVVAAVGLYWTLLFGLLSLRNVIK